MAIVSTLLSGIRSFSETNSFDELGYQIAVDDYTGIAFFIDKFGQNLQINSGQTEDIWSNGGAKAFPAVAAVTQVVSDSTDDDAGGTGALTVRVLGYDNNSDLITEDATMDGTTAVTLSASFKDIYRAIVLTAGSNETNVGNITIQHSTGSVVLGQIATGYGTTQLSHFTIPNNYTGFMVSYSTGVGTTSGGGSTLRVGEVSLLQRPDGGAWRYNESFGVESDSSPVNQGHKHPLIFPTKTQIKFICLAETNNTKAFVTYELYCINNNYLVNPPS